MDKELKKIINEVGKIKFTQGERKWCVKCFSEIKKELLKEIKKLNK